MKKFEHPNKAKLMLGHLERYTTPAQRQTAQQYESIAKPHAPCNFCGRACIGVDLECHGCWEVTSRLAHFMQTGPEAQAFVRRTLEEFL